MTVTLTWADGVNPPGTTYNVYRKPASGPPTAYVEAASGLTVLTFKEVVANDSYNYYVTANFAGQESNGTPVTQALFPVAPPTMLVATVTLP